MLSDLHGAEFGAGSADLFAAVAAEAPDYIFYLGDLQDKYRGPEPGYPEEIAGGLSAIAPPIMSPATTSGPSAACRS